MDDNGLNNVMELIKRQKWENLFKRRELVHVDAVKEFYAKMTVIHLKKRDVVKSKVRGVDLEFDHEKLATILGVPGKNGICEYIKEVWEESKYTKPLEITRRFANDENIMVARRVKSGELKPFQRFVHFWMKQAVEGNAGRVKGFMMLRMKLEALRICMMRFSDGYTRFGSAKERDYFGVDPRVLLARIQ
ncbi:hypothetical protein Dimus_003168 [Dionaea muscipula]